MATSTNSDTNQYTTAALYQRTSRDLRPEQSRKRNRDEDEDDSELVSLSLDSIDDGPTKPRRVNPQSKSELRAFLPVSCLKDERIYICLRPCDSTWP